MLLAHVIKWLNNTSFNMGGKVDTSWMLSGMLAIINGLLFFVLKRFNDRLDDMEEEVQNLKLNYISRFESATADRVALKETLLRAITDMKLENERSHNAIVRMMLDERKNKT